MPSGRTSHDPRTGEILDADIQFYHNVMNLAKIVVFPAGRTTRQTGAEIPDPG